MNFFDRFTRVAEAHINNVLGRLAQDGRSALLLRSRRKKPLTVEWVRATSCTVACASPTDTLSPAYCYDIDVFADASVGSVSVSCSGKGSQLCENMDIRAGGVTNALTVDCSDCTKSDCCKGAQVSACPAASAVANAQLSLGNSVG